MTYPHDHTPGEHRNALADLARDICLHIKLCPDCGEEMTWEPATWEGDELSIYGLSKVPAGWGCCGCGRWESDEEHDDE